MVFLALTVLGSFAYLRLQVDLFPELDFPSISVLTTYPGVGPEEMETLVTRPVESAVARVNAIERVESTSSEGRSRVSLRFEWGYDLEAATNDVRASLERIRPLLPDDVDPPIVFKFDLTNFPVLILALDGSLDEGRLRKFADETVIPRLERVSGVASVELQGAREREIRIELSLTSLAAYGLSPDDVLRAIRDANLAVPGGLVGDGSRNILVRAIGEYSQILELANTVVAVRNEVPIRVSQVASVADAYEDYINIVRIDGNRGVQLRIIKGSDANTIEVADALYREIESFNRDYQNSAKLSIVVDSSVFIRRSIADVNQSMLLGAALAVLVLLVFLRSIRSTLVIVVAIPISIIATLWAMEMLGLTLNLITFGGLALGVGMLVDGAIVVLENIFRHRTAGASPKVAAIRGGTEVGTAVVASTLTTLAVFAPVLFLGGFASVFFGQMALVVSAALLCSLLVALTLVPVLSSVFLRGQMTAGSTRGVSGLVGRFLDAVDGAYAAVVRWALRFPWLVVVVAATSLWWVWTLRDGIGRELLPESDESEVRVNVQFPAGTRIETTEEVLKKLEQLIDTNVPEKIGMLTNIGPGGGRSTAGEESASIRVNLSPVGDRTRTSAEVARDLTPKLTAAAPGARISARAGTGLWIFNVIRGGDDRVSVEVRGFDVETGDQLAEQVVKAIEDVPGLVDARSSRLSGGQEARLVIDRERCADLGLTPRQVAEFISTLTQGSRAGLFREKGDEYAIRVILNEEARESMEWVLSSPMKLANGVFVPLRQLVHIEMGKTPQGIDRLNQERLVVVGAGTDGTRELSEVVSDVQEQVQKLVPPEGFSLLVAGESAEQEKTFADLTLGIILALLLVYMVMAAQFESFVQPLVILCSVPFAAIGVILTLLWTDTTLNINSFMGMIVLVGVVVNNAIVLIDYTNLLRRGEQSAEPADGAEGESSGLPLREAVIEAARRRLRPILMTTGTTVLALLPVAIGVGAGGDGQAPLARVVVGGMLSSTLVTLVLVPVLYTAVEKALGWLKTKTASPMAAAVPDNADM